MPHRELKNKPLVEAVFELEWPLLEQSTPGIYLDPHYKMLLGRFYERVMQVYPVHETMPAAAMPEAMVAYSAQHLFRVGDGKWPAVQIGPGILSVHEREEYSWNDFAWRCREAVSKLFDAYPKSAELKTKSLKLRYIDAVALDSARENVLDFLKDKFKTRVELPAALFWDGHVRAKPSRFSWEASFEDDQPRGAITVRFATGQRDSRPAFLWETVVESKGEELPAIPRDFEAWLREAHALSEDWFFKLIEGDLEKNFVGE